MSTVSDCTPDCAPDCAVHSAHPAPETPNASGRARERARAREDSGPSAQSPPNRALTPGDQIKAWRVAMAALFTPPDIVRTDRPSLQKAWAYASRGEWTSPTGAPRRAGQVYAWFAISAKAALYTLDWIIERPARAVTAAALVALFAQFPPLSWLL